MTRAVSEIVVSVVESCAHTPSARQPQKDDHGPIHKYDMRDPGSAGRIAAWIAFGLRAEAMAYCNGIPSTRGADEP
jgi:hypothetical protein